MSWSILADFLISGNEDKTLCLVLGAGIHRFSGSDQTSQDREKIDLLSSWNGLLRSMNIAIDEFPSPALNWEFELLKKDGDTGELSAWERDQLKLKRLTSNIQNSEDYILSSTRLKSNYEPLIEIITSGRVTDVIVLNYDLLLERLLEERGYKMTFYGQRESNAIRCRILTKSKDNSTFIRFWHPNGDRGNRASIKLGMWHYAKMITPMRKKLSDIKTVRNTNSRNQLVDDYCALSPTHWLELYMFRPLLFAGTSLSTSDWSQWYALLMRWRNFTKGSNSVKEEHIWRLTAESEKLQLPRNKFHFLEAIDYPEAWTKLNSLFKG